MSGASCRGNCFDLIRHVAALAVLVSHHYALSKMPVPKFMEMVSYGNLSVTVFFAISGYLVTSSFLRTGSFWPYFEKRLRRLFPGLVVCSAIMIFVLCGLLGKDSYFDYALSSRAYGAFVGSVWMEGFRDANGFTADFLYPNSVNGSLWTLRYEFFSYIIIPASIILFRRKILAVLFILLASLAYQGLYASGVVSMLSMNRVTSLLIPYCVGAMFVFCGGWLSKNRVRIPLSLLCFSMLIAIPKSVDFMPVFNICISIVSILIGLAFRERLIGGRFDYSYGFYIYAFPVQQVVINMTSLGFYQSMFASAIISTALAAASWHLVEKPFIMRHKAKDKNKELKPAITEVDAKPALEKAA